MLLMLFISAMFVTLPHFVALPHYFCKGFEEMNPVVESFLNELTVDVAKEVLRCPHLEALHQSDTELYLFLYVYFQKLAIQQKHERSIAISKADVSQVLSLVLVKQLASASQAGVSRIAKTKDVFVQQRALRDQLTSLKINCSAFAEVVEVARLLDQKCGVTVPFGAVHLMHFVAVFITLCNVKLLFELVELVLDCRGLDHADKVRLVELWATIDTVNGDALRDVCHTMADHPNITAPLLLELMPSAQDIHTEKYQPSAKVQPPKVVEHSADEEVAVLDPNPVTGSAQPIRTEQGDGGGDEDEFSGDEEMQRSEEDKAFWANLAK